MNFWQATRSYLERDQRKCLVSGDTKLEAYSEPLSPREETVQKNG